MPVVYTLYTLKVLAVSVFLSVIFSTYKQKKNPKDRENIHATTSFK